MKNRMLRKFCFIFVFSVISMTACSSNNKNSTGIPNQNTVSPTIDMKNNDTLGITVTPEVEPAATKEVNIYTLNVDSKEVEARVALVSKDTQLTPELIVSLVTDSLADGMINADIDEVSEQGDCVIVSFMSDAAPVTDSDRETETAILDVLAQSLIDNFIDEYPKVIFRIQGEAYKTDQYSFGIDEVYLDGTKTNLR